MARSLMGRGGVLSPASAQREVLKRCPTARPFEESLAASGLFPLKATGIETLQVNVGKLCNQTCAHCHVDAGPDRRELMTRETMEQCIWFAREARVSVIDITGGAPEMNPQFRWLVGEAKALGCRVIDRCNLTILLARGFDDLPEFLAAEGVEVYASLPYFLASRTDAQRGSGVFDASIRAIRRLNELGYGREGSGLLLNLVYNPTGAFLPGPQAPLEADFRRELSRRHGVSFNRLFALANMPISRFLDGLVEKGLFDEYMGRLAAAYNPIAAGSAMCRTMLSVGWDGRLYDCDFNQMLELPLAPGAPRTIAEASDDLLRARPIVTGLHCYGCAAGAGSGCGGETVNVS